MKKFMKKVNWKKVFWTIFMIIWTIYGAGSMEGSWCEDMAGFMWIIGGVAVYVVNMLYVDFTKSEDE